MGIPIMTSSFIRSIIKNILPKPIVHFIGMFLHRGFRPQLRYLINTPIYKHRFKKLMNGLSEPQIAIYPGGVLEVHPDARKTFEPFTHQDAELVEEMDAFMKLTADKYCLLDIGAHYGIFSLAFTGRPHSVAFALDPSSSAYEMLCYHQKANPDHNLKPFLLALGDSEGKLRMQSSWTYLVALPLNTSTNEDSFEVKITTIDSFIEQQGIVPDAIKIDVEGFEINVLKGGSNLLTQNDPIIFLEVHTPILPRFGNSVKEVVEIINSYGYNLYDGRGNLIKKPSQFFGHAIRRVICSKNSL